MELCGLREMMCETAPPPMRSGAVLRAARHNAEGAGVPTRSNGSGGTMAVGVAGVVVVSGSGGRRGRRSSSGGHGVSASGLF